MTKPTRVAVCVQPDTWPATIANRPSLSRIAYRIGTYVDARRHLLNALDADPVLQAWTYRGADDPGIALYESAAELVDNLTLYQEVYANEAFLRTATWPESVADLVRLTGYLLAPGLGGTGTFAIEATGTAPVVLPAGSAITASLADEPQPASFQTSAAATALPWLSRFSLLPPQAAPMIENGMTQLVVQDPAQTFNAGDRVLIGASSESGTALSPWEIVVVASVARWNGRALLTLQGAIGKCGGAGTALSAYKLGDTYHHFGASAPAQVVTVTGGVASTTTMVYTRDFSTDGTGTANISPTLTTTQIALDPQTTSLALGSQLAIEAFAPPTPTSGGGLGHGRRVEPRPWLWVRRITDLRAVTGQYGALTGAATIATLDSVLDGITTIDLREIQIDQITTAAFQVGAPWVDLAPATGATLAWWGDDAQAQSLLGRTIAFEPASGTAYTRTVLAVAPDPYGGRSIVTLDQDVDYADFPDTPTTVVFGNLVGATEGKAAGPTVLGNGDDQQTFQSFQIPAGPLTYLAAPALTPPQQPQLAITVGNRIWQYVPVLYGQAADAEVYVVLQDHSGNFWVQFGDGVTGARLPSGVGNVQISYRTGAGAYGPMKGNASPSLAGRVAGISSLDLAAPIEGGAAPETPDSARAAAPARVQTLDRLVSVADIQAEALAIAGVELAQAAWTIADDLPCVQVTVLMQPGRIADVANVQSSLTVANRARGPARFPIVVAAGATEYVYLDLTVAIDPTYAPAPVLAAVEAALGVTGLEAAGIDGSLGLFGEQGAFRGFGGAEYATRIEAFAQNVAGVVWATCNALGSLGAADDPSGLVYPSAPALADTLPCAPATVLRLYSSGDAASPLILRTASVTATGASS